MPPNNSQLPRPDLQGHRLWSGLSVISKRSFRSYTSSFEADDERSSTDGDMSPPRSSDSDSDDAPGRRLADVDRYAGYDARPTSRKELGGWYAYSFAAETYVVCGIGKATRTLQMAYPDAAARGRPASAQTNTRSQAPSSPSCSSRSLAKTASCSRTPASRAAPATARTKMTGSASSTSWASRSTRQASPCTRFP